MNGGKCEGRASDHPQPGPHQHRAPVPSWRVPGRDLAAEAPSLSSQRFPSDTSPDTLNSISAKAYRRVMSRFINQLTPNPRLQRTRCARR